MQFKSRLLFKITGFVLTTIFFLTKGMCQSPAQNVPNFEYNQVLLPSPTAAGINKGGDASVNLSTGTPNVSIPLYDIKSRFLSMPISINYSSNGINVNELASNVGLGWSLNAGGVVSRIVMGKPDENRGADNQSHNNFNTHFNTAWDTSIYNYAVYSFDRESDIFSYNVNGISGKFIFDANNNPRSLNSTNVRIKAITTSLIDNSFRIDGFQITDDNGILYTFGIKETTRHIETGYQGPKPYENPVTTGWYLSTIIRPGQDTISFTYQSNSYTYLSSVSETESINTFIQTLSSPCTPQDPPDHLYSEKYSRRITKTVVDGVEIKSIVFPGGVVDFSYVSRKDGGNLALAECTVKNSSGNLIKRVKFIQDYFRTTQTSDPFLIDKAISDSALWFRLYLKEINQVNVLDTVSVLKHIFSYNNGNGLPQRCSGSQDYFGFYNGASNTYLLPDVSDDYPGIYTAIGIARKGQREPDSILMQYGLLTKVQYPTGGYDTISYSANKGLESELQRHFAFFTLGTYGLGLNGSKSVTQAISLASSQKLNISFQVYFDPNATSGCVQDELHQQGQFTITSAQTTQVVASGFLKDGLVNLTSAVLPAGNYTVKVTSVGQCTFSTVGFDYENAVPDTIMITKLYGGMGVARIVSCDKNGSQQMTRSYSYTNKNDGKYSTFKILKKVNFYTNLLVKFFDYTCEAVGTFKCDPTWEGNYLNIASSVQNPLSIFGGNITYNTSVLESVESSTSNAVTEHIFSFNSLLNPNTVNGNGILNTPLCVYEDFMIGETTTNFYSFAKNQQQYSIVKSITNQFDIELTDPIYNYNVRQLYAPICTWSPPDAVQIASLDIDRYPIVFMKKTLKNHVEKLYSSSDGTQFVKDSIIYTYGIPGYVLPRSFKKMKSDQKETSVQYKYPFDNAGEAVYDSMVVRNMVGVVQEQTEFSNSIQQNKQMVNYGFTDPVARKIIAPFLIQNQIRSNAVENIYQVYKYNDVGNVQERSRSNDVHEVYLWGYSSVYPVAKVVGSDYTTVSGFIDQSILDNPASDQALRNELNKIRTGLVGTKAQVVTYTYAPLVGITSETDQRGKTNYYEYDGFKRLKLIRDQDGNVVKLFDYQYQIQP